jgi:peroxiredoxin
VRLQPRGLLYHRRLRRYFDDTVHKCGSPALKVSGVERCRLHFERRSHKIVILGVTGVNRLYVLLTWAAIAFTFLPAEVAQDIRRQPTKAILAGMAIESTMLALGTSAPHFALPEPATGATVSLDDLAGPALVVTFICNHCPYVKHVAAGLTALGRDLADQGVAVVAISSNDVDTYPQDGPDQMAVAARDYGWTFPYLYDETQDVARAYSAACTPDTFVFDGERRLVYRGQLDNSRPGNDLPVNAADVRAAVDAVVAGRPVDADQRPSIGCGIKWR